MREQLISLLNIRRYRWSELFLLIMPALFIVLASFQLQLIATTSNTSTVQFTPNTLPGIDIFGPQFFLILAFLATHVVLSWLLPEADQTILPITAMLSSVGVLLATRLGPDLPTPDKLLGYRQAVWVILGLVFCIATVFVTRSMRWLRLYKYTWALGGVALVAITLIHARNVNFDSPTHDQLSLGPAGIAFQPSELLKICLVIFYAAYLAENREMLTQAGPKIGQFQFPPLKHMGPLILLLGLSLVLFVGLRELGLALLIFGVFVSMIYMASGRLSYVIYSLIGFSGGALIAYNLFSYVRDRVAI